MSKWALENWALAAVLRPEVNSTYGKTVATIRCFRDNDAAPGEADDASDAKIY